MTIGGTACADRSLVYLNNRYHDPTLGIFISVDPLVTITGQPYTYGNASPIAYSDPTGLKGCDSNHRCPGGPGGRPRSSGGGASGPAGGGAPGPGVTTDQLATDGFDYNCRLGYESHCLLSTLVKSGATADAVLFLAGMSPVNYFAAFTGDGELPAELDQLISLAGFQAGLALLAFEDLQGDLPDYIVFDLDVVSEHLVGGGLSVTFSRSGAVFFGFQGEVGTPGLTFAGRAGVVFVDGRDGPATADEIDALLGGWGFAGNLSVRFTAWAFNKPLSDWNPNVAMETGFSTSPLGVSLGVSYSDLLSGVSTSGW